MMVIPSISYTTRSSTIPQSMSTEMIPASSFCEVMTPWDQSEHCPIPKYGADQNNKLDNESMISSSNAFDDIIQDVIQEGNIGAIKHHDTGSYCADNLNDEI